MQMRCQTVVGPVVDLFGDAPFLNVRNEDAVADLRVPALDDHDAQTLVALSQ